MDDRGERATKNHRKYTFDVVLRPPERLMS
jgi:hypothetical protein